jgi:cellulose synthase/poly-beta-1,6-N-acetylglucosamine synthase-like glycosyltransferase
MKTLQLNVEELRKKRLFVGVPMYGGNCAGLFNKSMTDLAYICGKYQIDLKIHYLFNESLITRARNYIVDEFLRSDYDYFLFIDADIGFEVTDALTLLFLADDEHQIIAGPYPKKTIAWEKITKAVNRGFGKDNPGELNYFVGDFVFNPVSSETSFKIDEMLEIREAGTGFMLMTRQVLQDIVDKMPEIMYTPDHIRTENFDGTRKIAAIFDIGIDPTSNRYLSEDYLFCYRARNLGYKVWLCPWMSLTHVGMYMFSGSIQAMAAIDATPTADESSAFHRSPAKTKQLTDKLKGRR